MQKILLSIRVIPIGTGSSSLSGYIAKVIEVFERRKLKYHVTPFSTAIELDNIDELPDIIKEITSSLSNMGVKRIAIDIQLDIRLDKLITLEYKVESVMKRLEYINQS